MAEPKSEKILKEIKKISHNYWAVATIVLAIVLIILLVNGNAFSTSIGKAKAGQSVVDFLNSQTGGGVELVEITSDGEFYQVMVSYQGQNIPLSVTKDGKYLAQLTLLESNPEDTTPTQPQAAENLPQTDKPVVEAFVMSHCPYGTQIEKGLIPVVELLGDKINFEVKFVYYAMHGETEVREELNQYCIQTEQNDKYLSYLKCFLGEGDGEACLDETGIDKTKLKTCTDATDKKYSVIANLNDQSSWLSGRYPLFDVYKEDNEKYGVGGSPTLIVNGVEANSGRDSVSLLATVCNAFTDDARPAECDSDIDASSPTPGFGYSTTSGSGTDATCG